MHISLDAIPLYFEEKKKNCSLLCGSIFQPPCLHCTCKPSSGLQLLQTWVAEKQRLGVYGKKLQSKFCCLPCPDHVCSCSHTCTSVRFRFAHAIKKKNIIVTLNPKAALGKHGYSKISMSFLHWLTCLARCNTCFSNRSCAYNIALLTNIATSSD